MNLIHYSPDFELSPANLEFVTEKLNRLRPPIAEGADVQFDIHRNHHHIHGQVFQVRLQTTVHKELIIGQFTAPDFQDAIEGAIEKFQALYARYHEKKSSHHRSLWHRVNKYFSPEEKI
jgi:ribosome-associated translation inhibitor RaiA